MSKISYSSAYADVLVQGMVLIEWGSGRGGGASKILELCMNLFDVFFHEFSVCQLASGLSWCASGTGLF
jgi:hypothetical protein